MITHNPEAAAIGDRILHMRDGRMLQHGPRRQTARQNDLLRWPIPHHDHLGLIRRSAWHRQEHARRGPGGRLQRPSWIKTGCVRRLFPGHFTDYTAQQDDLCMGAMLAAAAYLTEQRTVNSSFSTGAPFPRERQIDGGAGRRTRRRCLAHFAPAHGGCRSRGAAGADGCHPSGEKPRPCPLPVASRTLRANPASGPRGGYDKRFTTSWRRLPLPGRVARAGSLTAWKAPVILP